MKKIIIILILVFVSNLIIGQITTNIKTPMNNTVPDTGYRGELLNSTDKANLSDSIIIKYPNATEIDPPSATTHYNCHSFAWYRYEGGEENVWMGFDSEDAEDIYWLDGSYIEVSNIDDASKISYAGDHSAVKLSGTNCRSKWGPWPLVDHAIGYGPLEYNMSNRAYYTSFKVNGPQLFCSNSTATFTTPDYVDCTFNWIFDDNLLNYVSGQGTKTFVVEPKTSTSSGEALVILELTIDLDPDVTRTIIKTILVGTPAPGISNTWSESCNCYVTNPLSTNITYDWDMITSNTSTSSTNYVWEVWGYELPMLAEQSTGIAEMRTTYPYTAYGKHLSYIFDDEQFYTIRAKQRMCGSWSSWAEKYVTVGGGMMLLIAPNPATTETSITLESINNEQPVNEDVDWGFEVYSPSQNLKIKKINLRGKEHTIQTNSWKEGVYFVRAVYKDKIILGKLVIKK